MSRILIIDDDQDLLTLMHKILEKAKHDVTSIGNARELLDGSMAARFDLVITDIIMPEVDGLEVIAYLRDHHFDIKVLAISGGGCFPPEFHLTLASKSGATSTLKKPFRPSQLVAAVDRVLGRKKARRTRAVRPRSLLYWTVSAATTAVAVSAEASNPMSKRPAILQGLKPPLEQPFSLQVSEIFNRWFGRESAVQHPSDMTTPLVP